MYDAILDIGNELEYMLKQSICNYVEMANSDETEIGLSEGDS